MSGLVRDRAKGEPVAAVFVAAYDLDGARIGAMETDAAGSYSILLPPGAYVVVAADALRRYRTSWYDAAESFHLARQILLGSGIVWPIDFRLDSLLVSRIRPVRR